MTLKVKTFKKFISLAPIIIIFITSCNKDKKEAELAIISKYIETNNIIADTLSNGIYYAESGFSTLETLDSDYPQKGDTIKTIHKAYVLTEKSKLLLFEETTIDDPGVYVYKEDPIIKGWELTIGMMKKDASALVIIPSKLAYKNDRVGVIPPYSPLVFEVRILDIIHP